MTIRNIFVSDISSEDLRAAILGRNIRGAREERKWRCTICGTVHQSVGVGSLCPVCKRPVSGFCSIG